MTYCTYIHRQNSDGKVFYVGAGQLRRAYIKRDRSKEWYETVEKHGFSYERVAIWSTRQEAFDHEELLISCFKDMGHPLVNKSTGGVSGSAGTKQSPETVAKRVAHHIGSKRSNQTRENISASKLGVAIDHKKHMCLDCGKVIGGGKGSLIRHQKATDCVGFTIL